MSEVSAAAPVDTTPTVRRVHAVAYTTCIVLAVFLYTAIAFRESGLLEWVRPLVEQDNGHPRRWVFVAAPVLLLLLSIFHVSRKRSERGFSIDVSALSLSFSAGTTLILCVLFGALLAEPADSEQTLVYILGFAALIIGGQHLVEFETAQRTLEGVNSRLSQSTGTLNDRLGVFEDRMKTLTDGIDSRVTELRDTLGYTKYRDIVNRAYGQARRRVLASTNHWPTDPAFWTPDLGAAHDLDALGTGFWEAQHVFANLRNAIHGTRGGTDPLRMVFAGRLSVTPAEDSPALAPQDFTLFVGVLWRLALAHRLREEMRGGDANDAYLEKSCVRVMVADLPINCHVIDDKAFLLLHLPGDEGARSYGLELPTGSGAASHDQPGRARPCVADTYAEIIDRHTRTHVRSAREYAASLLVLAATATAKNPFEDVELMRDGVPRAETVKMLLDALGMQAWIERQCGPDRDIPTDVEMDEHAWEAGAMLLVCDFLKHYYAREKIFQLPERAQARGGWYDGMLTVDLIIEDLI